MEQRSPAEIFKDIHLPFSQRKHKGGQEVRWWTKPEVGKSFGVVPFDQYFTYTCVQYAFAGLKPKVSKEQLYEE